MIYICMFFLALVQTISATESDNTPLRMGFNNAKNDLSVLFCSESALKFKELEGGKQVYYINASDEQQKIVYEFGCHGFGLESLETFKNNHLEAVKSQFLAKDPAAKCSTTADDKLSDGRTRAVVEYVSNEGERALFVGEFHSVEGKIYLVSETIEGLERGTDPVIDESFFTSFELQRK